MFFKRGKDRLSGFVARNLCSKCIKSRSIIIREIVYEVEECRLK